MNKVITALLIAVIILIILVQAAMADGSGPDVLPPIYNPPPPKEQPAHPYFIPYTHVARFRLLGPISVDAPEQ